MTEPNDFIDTYHNGYVCRTYQRSRAEKLEATSEGWRYPGRDTGCRCQCANTCLNLCVAQSDEHLIRGEE